MEYLLKQYLEKKISESEKAEFFGYVRDDEASGFLKSSIAKELESDGEASPESDRIYEAILKRNGIERHRRWPWAGVAAWGAVAAAVVLVLMLWLPGREAGSGLFPVAGKDEHVLERRVYRESEEISLPDGSRVLLKPNSELIALYTGDSFEREVILKGEAFFDIRHDPSATFIVHTGDIHTRVLGTAFNIRTWAGETEVTVARGMVEVSREGKSFGKLTAREQITIKESSSSIQTLSEAETELFSLDLLPLVFDEATLDEVFEEVGRRFRTNILADNPGLGKCRISASFTHGESLEEILDLVCQMRHAGYTREGSNIKITGGRPCN